VITETRPTPAAAPADARELMCVVTTEDYAMARTWRVRVASTGLRVYRPGDPVDERDVPVLAIHVCSHDAWLSWAEPCDRTATAARLRRAQREAEAWLNSRGRPAEAVRKHRMWGDSLDALCRAGFGVGGSPGDAGWLEFDGDERVDWRAMADAIRMAVDRAAEKRGDSWGRSS
jgi:hypothetical protein